ncbi:group II truncated hemoglobin [Pontiellaceae bacterium B1224]|nr:group II truncated hemoglobin [Pontiellaceae bacterium B1224]
MTQDIEELYEKYREGDNQYRIAGGEAGCYKLANDFYDVMEELAEARKILFMHPGDLTESREKLARFLAGYMNGPELYEMKYGPLALGPAHSHLAIGTAEKDAWMLCMKKAVAMQDWPEEFKTFMLSRLQTPADRIQNRP